MKIIQKYKNKQKQIEIQKYTNKCLQNLCILIKKRKSRSIHERWFMNCIWAFECCLLIIFEMSLLTAKDSGQGFFPRLKMDCMKHHPKIFTFCTCSSFSLRRCLGLAKLCVYSCKDCLESIVSYPWEIILLADLWTLVT